MCEDGAGGDGLAADTSTRGPIGQSTPAHAASKPANTAAISRRNNPDFPPATPAFGGGSRRSQIISVFQARLLSGGRIAAAFAAPLRLVPHNQP